MPIDDRDQQWERALTRFLRDASPESHCPDAEILSAYQERSLSESQLAYWKEHIAACVRCQEILALVEQSEDVYGNEGRKHEEEPVEECEELAVPLVMRAAAPQAAARKPIPVAAPAPASEPQIIPMRPRWRWLVPVGALAACAVVAVGIREIQTQRHKAAALAVQMARNEGLTPAATDSGAAAVRAPAVPAERKDQPARKETAEQQALDKALQDQTAHESVPPSSSPGRESMAEKLPPRLNSPEPSRDAKELRNAARMKAPAASQQQEERKAQSAVAPPAPAPQPPALAAAGALAKKTAPEQKQDAGGASAYLEAQGEVSNADVAALQQTRPKPEVMNRVAAAPDRRYIVAPDAKSVWRVGDSGKIERSDDRGKTWKPQTSNVTEDLTSGSAVSDKVCWVVGRNGTILVSVDGGKSWNPVTSPIAGDIGGIRATDALHASIWDAPRHVSFETSDGGASWTRNANE